MRRTLVCLAATLALDCAWAPAARAGLPPIKHVFVIVLENKDYDQSFGSATQAPYLATELTRQGQLLTHYYGTSHASLGNYVSMVSGLAPNPDTQGDCAHGFNNVFPGVATPDGQVLGVGCVYPGSAKTIADQLESAGLTWKGYLQDMGNDPSAPKTCRHPAIGEVDDTQSARNGDQYATRHNPFVYFHSIIDRPTCQANVVPLDRLPADLGTAATTPNFSFITPNLCDDGHDGPCVDGAPGGLKGSDAFLRVWVPRIVSAPAFVESGALMIVWDEGSVTAAGSESCCGEQSGPNTPAPGIVGAGGGRTGGVVLSPYVRGGSVNATPYNHYSFLRTIEDVFHVGHLGYAAATGLKAFGDDVFGLTSPLPVPVTRPGCSQPRIRRARGGRLQRGSLLGRVAVTRSGPRPLLRVSAYRAATLTLRARRGMRSRRFGPRRVRACETLRVHVPYAHGRLLVQARSHSGSETRRLSF